MLTDTELERFARHLSLTEIGIPGQETLCATHVTCLIGEAWAHTFREALQRAGVAVNDTPAQEDATRIAVVHDPELSPNTVTFAPDAIRVATIDFGQATTRDASAPVMVKQLWLGAALACEAILWRLGHRSVCYSLALDFPLLTTLNT